MFIAKDFSTRTLLFLVSFILNDGCQDIRAYITCVPFADTKLLFFGIVSNKKQFASSSGKLSKVQLGQERVVKSTKRVLLLGPVIIVHKQVYRYIYVSGPRSKTRNLLSLSLCCSLGCTIARWRAVYICAQLCRRRDSGIEHYVSAKGGRRTRAPYPQGGAWITCCVPSRATSWSPPPLRYPTVNIGCPSPHCSSTVTRLLPSAAWLAIRVERRSASGRGTRCSTLTCPYRPLWVRPSLSQRQSWVFKRLFFLSIYILLTCVFFSLFLPSGLPVFNRLSRGRSMILLTHFHSCLNCLLSVFFLLLLFSFEQLVDPYVNDSF